MKIAINDVPIPEPSENQFLVKKIHSASLCHSNLINALRSETDMTLGHEGVGFIEKIHRSAEDEGFIAGDAIGFNYCLNCCFECDGCMVHNMRCETVKQQLQGFIVDGFFAEYAVIDYHNAIHLPKNLDMKRCAPIFCAGITGKISLRRLTNDVTYSSNYSMPSTAANEA